MFDKTMRNMMRNLILVACSVLLFGMHPARCQSRNADQRKQEATTGAKETGREYSIIVYERPSDAPLSFERELSNGRLGLFWGGIFDVYRNAFAAKTLNYSSGLLDTGVSLITQALNQKKTDYNNWRSSMQKEMTYTRKLPMQTEIADFYRDVSHVGAMDPEGIMFNGLGCRQYLTYRDESGQPKKILVFEIACSLDDSEKGKQRILHHGKFEIKVDSVLFNPYLCDLPNDSLTARQVEEALRIPFDFKRRKNLTFRLTATLTSSWMNEAIEIFQDQALGRFQIDFSIPDSTVLDTDGVWKGYYTYRPDRDYADPKKNVRATGESFIVPRSFIGTYKESDDPASALVSQWGTGQYKIDMQISETCQMNEQYYASEEKWKEEWRILKKRKKKPSMMRTLVDQFRTEFDMDDYKWIHTILDPVKSAIIVDEKRWINNIMAADGSVPSAQPTASGQGEGNPAKNGKK